MEIIKDLNSLTSIPEKILEKLSDNILFLILQNLEETLIKKENVCEINLNLGILIISIEEEELKFKFIPSKKLEKEILKTLELNENSMNQILTNNMINALEKTYKELL